MKEKIPEGSNLANYLVDILCMGKEAIYRRLRGEVAFTFDEVAVISRKLGISLDKIVGNNLSGGTLFDLHLPHVEDPMENYREILVRYLNFFRYVKSDPSAEVCTASNIVPYTFYSQYRHLSRFRLCRWLYQHGRVRTPHALADLDIPADIVDLQRELSETVRQIPKTTFIWDGNMFQSLVDEIRYFAELRLITDEDVMLLRDDLLRLIRELEQLTMSGRFNTGTRLAIYLSRISFEATYSYVERRDFRASMFRVYAVNSMDSQNDLIGSIQKDWLQFLKRHATLISQSGEIQRVRFFSRQRAIIESLACEPVEA